MPQQTKSILSMWWTPMQTERNEIIQLLEKIATTRRPCLRRSNERDALLATDLPLVTDAEGVCLFRTMAEKCGWTVNDRNGWILLDRVPGKMTVVSSHGPEALACASLLERHPCGEPDDELWRELVKACEEGKNAEEQAFAHLHALLAEKLRMHVSLPDLKII